MHQIASDPAIRKIFPAFAEGAEHVGSLQIRQRATIGGNLCNASPCMDTAPGLLAYGAEMRIVGPKGERTIPISEFFLNVRKTVLEPGELLLTIRLPKPPKALRSAFGKVSRVRGHDLALVNLALAIDVEAKIARACVGSCSATPAVVTLEGLDLTAIVTVGDALAEAMNQQISPIDDVRASAEYRRDMTAMLCRRLSKALLEGGEK